MNQSLNQFSPADFSAHFEGIRKDVTYTRQLFPEPGSPLSHMMDDELELCHSNTSLLRRSHSQVPAIILL